MIDKNTTNIVGAFQKNIKKLASTLKSDLLSYFKQNLTNIKIIINDLETRIIARIVPPFCW